MALFLMGMAFFCKLCCFTMAIIAISNSIVKTSANPTTLLSDGLFMLTSPHVPASSVVQSEISHHQIPRYKRSTHNHNKNFIRLGRSDSYDRKSEKNLIRFGRNDASAKSNGFIRFGRASGGDKGFIRFGRDDNSDAVRFGRRGDKFIRFGRSNGGNVKEDSPIEDLVKFERNGAESAMDSKNSLFRSPVIRSGRNGNFIRFGKRDNGFIRFGKKQSNLDNDDNKFNDNDVSESNEYIQNDLNEEPVPVYHNKAMASVNLDENREKLMGTDYL